MESKFKKAKQIREIGLNALESSKFNMPFYDEKTGNYKWVIDKKYQFKATLIKKYIDETWTETKFGGFTEHKQMNVL